MSPEEAFEAWAPPSSPWSIWAKPVLFACTAKPMAGATPAPGQFGEVPWAPAPAEGAALVVNVAGARSAMLGLALARRGYRPVPLYNCVYHEAAIVSVQELVAALFELAEELQALSLPADAPPAFLLDSRRLEGAADLAPGKFDNRWLVLPQDFPSANPLLARNINRALLVQEADSRVPDDLAHVLLRWQQAGIRIELLDASSPEAARPIVVHRPWGFRRAWYRVLVLLGLRRHSAGGFGSLVPESSASG